MHLRENPRQRFERALIEAAEKVSLFANDPVLAPVMKVVRAMIVAVGVDPVASAAAMGMLRHWHRVYQAVIIHDCNFTKTKTNRRVLRVKRSHLPAWSPLTFEDVERLWPALPLASQLFEKLRARSWPPETLVARAHEHLFVSMCTVPTLMSGELGLFARHVVGKQVYRFPVLRDPQVVADIADAVIRRLENRPAPVARYIARAHSVEEAATNVRVYVEAIIKRRSREEFERELALHKDVPPSTARRWRTKGKISDIDDPQVRRVMKERQTGVQEGRVSVKSLAKHFERSRSVVERALARAEKQYDFVTERGRNRAAQLTPQQARWVRACLPPKQPPNE